MAVCCHFLAPSSLFVSHLAASIELALRDEGICWSLPHHQQLAVWWEPLLPLRLLSTLLSKLALSDDTAVPSIKTTMTAGHNYEIWGRDILSLIFNQMNLKSVDHTISLIEWTWRDLIDLRDQTKREQLFSYMSYIQFQWYGRFFHTAKVMYKKLDTIWWCSNSKLQKSNFQRPKSTKTG